MTPESLSSDLVDAHAMILAGRAAQLTAEADRSSGAALIVHLKLQISTGIEVWFFRTLCGVERQVKSR